MTAKILITGANGFSGRHACEHFAQLGMEVIKVMRLKKDSSDHVLCCDLTDCAQVEKLIEEVQPDYVLHLAGRNSVSESWKEPVAYIESNVMSTFYLLHALRNLPHCRTVIVGSVMHFEMKDDPEPQNPYSLSKTLQVVAAQCWWHLFGLKVMMARPTNLIGPGNSNGICGLLAKKVVEIEIENDSTPFRLSSLIEQRDYLDVRDAVRAYETILLHGKIGTVYSLGSGRNHSLGDIANAYQSMIDRDLPLDVGQIQHYIPPQPVDIRSITELGWKPLIPLQQSLLDAFHYFKTRHGSSQ
ncbi:MULTISPECIES: NAD-dependent epimerase/dehydratase family protein [unclassified Paenibacillus]|uniref:NAD-dependent epimerase/dehydratase family protein n=1 Tax=unclassified Paenibacillus TaxID=185978 RepID=UPI00070B400B|nr:MULTISPECIES: NAD-dependent epimerase/dehydratase family protein [unclassified Paenibacillus]KQX49172.1 hypothetical protein ASD40_13685 [Paenibacillus sp. Root444D2]KRE48652.1 hypothetical protein ASG85_26145 [Paenibacillus sp. Soil724D2]